MARRGRTATDAKVTMMVKTLLFALLFNLLALSSMAVWGAVERERVRAGSMLAAGGCRPSKSKVTMLFL